MPDWGLSLYLEAENGLRMLMDTGSSFHKLERNARALGLDLTRLDAIFISHWHADHSAALPDLLAHMDRKVPVFAPRRPGWLMRQQLWLRARQLRQASAELVEVREARELLPGFWSTGDLGGEHALMAVLEERGLVILTGCSHPGPREVVRAALAALSGVRPHALIGGFHISSYREGAELGRFLSEHGFRLVCPCHCTGLEAKKGIEDAFSGTTLQCGVGRRIEL